MKKMLFSLLLLGICFYCYSKKSTESLMIIFALILFVVMFDLDTLKENLDGTVGAVTPTDEAIQNLASMYNNKKLIADEIQVNKISVLGAIDVGGNINMTNAAGASINGEQNISITAKNDIILAADRKTNIGASAAWGGPGNLTVWGDIDMEKGQAFIRSNALSIHAKGQLVLDAAAGTHIGYGSSNTAELSVHGAATVKEGRGNVMRKGDSFRLRKTTDNVLLGGGHEKWRAEYS